VLGKRRWAPRSDRIERRFHAAIGRRQPAMATPEALAAPVCRQDGSARRARNCHRQSRGHDGGGDPPACARRCCSQRCPQTDARRWDRYARGRTRARVGVPAQTAPDTNPISNARTTPCSRRALHSATSTPSAQASNIVTSPQLGGSAIIRKCCRKSSIPDRRSPFGKRDFGGPI
jgi:hypothetical protein